MTKSRVALAYLLGLLIVTASAQTNNDNTLMPVWQAKSDVFGLGRVISAGLDVDHDGKGEFYVSDYVTGTKILFEAAGPDKYENVLELEDRAGLEWTNICDLNGDGEMEFVASIADPISHKTQLAFYEWNQRDLDGLNPGLKESPRVTSGMGFKGVLTSEALASQQLLPLNVDQDPNIELYSRIIINDKQTTIYAYELDTSDWDNLKLTLQDSFSVIPENHIHGPMPIDINKDGFKELLFLSNYRNVSYVWPVTGNATYGALVTKRWDPLTFTSSRWHNDQVVVDADRDGTDEIYIGTYYGETYCLQPKATIEETFTEANAHRLCDLIPNPQLDMMTLGMYGDHDQDGNVDLYYHSRDDAWLIDVEYKGGSVADSASYDVIHTVLKRFDGVAKLADAYWNIATGYYKDKNGYFASDMDNDGKREVVISGWQETLLNVGQPSLIVFESTVATTSVKTINTQIPENYVLHKPYPNPFNASTRILYELPHQTTVQLEIYDITGRLCKVIESGDRQAGRHSVDWQPQNLSSGIYLIALRAENKQWIQSVCLLK